MTDGEPTVAETLVTELGRLAEPIRDALDRGPDGVVDLLEDAHVAKALTGQEAEKVANALDSTVAAPLQVLDDEVLTPIESGNPPNLDRIDDVIDAVGDLARGLQSLDDLTFSGDVDAIGELLFDHLVVEYLHRYHGRTYNVLCLVGIVVDGGTDRPSEVHLSKLDDLLTRPTESVAEAFEWGSEDFRAFALLYYLEWLLRDVGLPADLYEQTATQVEALAGGQVEESVVESELRIPVLTVVGSDGEVESGVKLVPLPGDPGNSLPGLAVVPFGELQFDEEVRFAEDWLFNTSVSTGTTDWGLILRPDRDPELGSLSSDPGADAPPAEVHARAALQYDPTDDTGGETTLLGSPEGSRLAVRSLSGRVRFDYEAGEAVVVVEFPATGTIGVHPDDFDGFLREVMPTDGVFHDFDVTMGWSSSQGLFFERGGTMEVSLPQAVSLGPATLNEVYLAALPSTGDQPGLDLAGAVSATVELGPITGSVSRMGVSADVSFPENADGNLGPIDLDMGFEPPSGIGLSVDAGGVTGGGYLEFDPDNERYAGTLQLHIGDLVLNAVGLLTTRLPDGSSGFSLLVIIAGEFTPIQLGLGFTLNGVGGLLGINRSFRAEPLGAAVREGSLDSVLFPVDPVANAQRIISDLREIFPPTRDVHVFGPMAKLGYGTPAMVTADLAVLLEIPTFKLAVLGRLRARLPDEEAPLVVLNMDVVGILDPPGRRASIDASLVDSRIGPYTVSGDMAMRTSWGSNPRFVLSVGGFHPRFHPPADFPTLRRVRVGIGDPGGNPSIELAGYMALTSNTAQVGAGAHVRAKAGPASVEGQIAFDALFQFDPFKFVIDFLVSIAVRVFGKGFSVRVDGTLSGTAPWRVSGRVHIDLWLIELSANIDLTLGEADTREKLPPARVLPLLAEAVSTPSNWSAQLPPRGRTAVTLREVEADPDEVLVHPLGRLSVRQSVVPLGYTIELFRNATPDTFVRFQISAATLGDGETLVLTDPIKEEFAPAQFTQMTDAEKLDSPAFERLESGYHMAYKSAGSTAAEDHVQRARLVYETSVVDREETVYGVSIAELGAFGWDSARMGVAWETTKTQVKTCPVAAAWTQLRGAHYAGAVEAQPDDTIEDRESPTTLDSRTGDLSGRIRLRDEQYRIVDARTMGPVDLDAAPIEWMPKSEAKRALARHVAAHPEDAGRYQVVAAHRLPSATSASTPE